MADELKDDARGQVRLPAIVRSPVWELSRRLVLAIALLAFTVALVTYGADAAPAVAAVLRDDTEHRTERRWLSNRIKELETEAATRAGLSPQR